MTLWSESGKLGVFGSRRLQPLLLTDEIERMGWTARRRSLLLFSPLTGSDGVLDMPAVYIRPDDVAQARRARSRSLSRSLAASTFSCVLIARASLRYVWMVSHANSWTVSLLDWACFSRASISTLKASSDLWESLLPGASCRSPCEFYDVENPRKGIGAGSMTGRRASRPSLFSVPDARSVEPIHNRDRPSALPSKTRNEKSRSPSGLLPSATPQRRCYSSCSRSPRRSCRSRSCQSFRCCG